MTYWRTKITETNPPTLIPRGLLFGTREKADPRLSPNGKQLAYLAPVDGVLNVWVGPAGSPVGGKDYHPVTKDRQRGIRIYFWAEDNEHLVYLQDVGGNEDWRIHATDPKTEETRDLTPFEGVQAQLLAKNKRFPGTLLVGLNKENPQVHDVYRLSISSGGLELVAKNPGNVARIYLPDPRGANAARLVALDRANGATAVLAGDERYDVGAVLVNPDTYEVEAVAIERARAEWILLDESVREDFRAIERLNRGDFAVASRDRADERWLVAFTVDDGGASYYSYDRREGEGVHLFDARPELAGYTLARMEPISFTARDGLRIEGYLTLPPGAGSESLPMVLNVHGGPWARDGWGYDPEAQWLANRGYACLQINYRGSTGYGKAF